MNDIKIFNSPDSACYTFTFIAVLSTCLSYVAMPPEIDIASKIGYLLIFFGLLAALLLACKVIGGFASRIDKYFGSKN